MDFTELIGTPTSAITLIFASILVIERLINGGYLNFKIGKGENVSNINLGEKMDKLSIYYNHTTTELLEQIRDGVRDTNTKLEEFEKFGIKPRKE